MKRQQNFVVSVFFCVIVFSTAAHSLAAAPNIFNKVDADPKKSYVLAQEDGPWMIMVRTFSGDKAEERANLLAYEIRKKANLNAYVYERKFDFNASEGNDVSQRTMRKERYLKSAAKEFAVLIGDFQSIEDENYKKALVKIKDFDPKSLRGETSTGITTVNYNGKPLTNAFGAPNPLLPANYFNQKNRVDSFIEKLNSDSKYNLLDCKGRYTVRVATFTGVMEIRQDKVKEILSGKRNLDTALNKAGRDAANLCGILRAKGYEAYEFHDRESSIVTIGGFNEIGTMGPQGIVDLRPEIVRIHDAFKAKYTHDPVSGTGYHKPQKIQGIMLDGEPKVILAPKRHKDYLKSL